MALESEIFHTLPAGFNFPSEGRFISGGRDHDGVVYAFFYDPDTTGRTASCRLYFSLNEGRTGSWQQESWSQSVGAEGNGAGGTQPHLMIQPDGTLWAAMSTWDGSVYPHVLQRDPEQEEWGARGRYFIGFKQLQSAHPNVASFHAVADPSYRATATWNIAAVYITTSSPVGEAYYTDLARSLAPVEIHNAGDYIDVRILAGNNGWKMALLLDSSNILWSVAILGFGNSVTFSSRIQVDTSVQTLEDVAVRFDNNPAVIYRKLSGAWQLHFAEYQPLSSSWATQRVWDGVNDGDFRPGQALGFDQKGSVFVVGYGDSVGVSPAEDDEMVVWRLLRGVDPDTTTWTISWHTTDTNGTPNDAFIINDFNPLHMGFQPQRPIQGLIFLIHIHSQNVVSPLQESVAFINFDQIDNPTTNYPTRLQQYGGEPFFRLADTETRASQVLTAEDAPGVGGTVPYIPSFEFVEEQVFQTSEVRFEAGYSAQIARFEQGRTIYSLKFSNLDTGRAAVLRNFFEERQRDGDLVTLQLPDEAAGDEVDLHVTPTPVVVTKEHGGVFDDSIWSLNVQMISKV